MAIGNLAKDQASRGKLVEEDVVEVLSLICSQSKTVMVQISATSALCELAQDTTGQQRMVRKGVISNLVQLCTRSQDPQVFTNSAMALSGPSISAKVTTFIPSK